jgi:hypothetical protein
MPDSVLASPHRSVVPLVDFWRDPAGRLHQLGDLLGVDLSETTEIAFEYAVPVKGGRGKASFTDVMISGPKTALALEAKFTEPPYELVSKWLRDPAEANRIDVLKGWLDLINKECGAELTQQSVAELPYQLIHRTASVCSVSSKERGVLYLLFKRDGMSEYTSGISKLSALLPAEARLRFAAIECTVADTPALARLEDDWKNNKREDMAKKVRTALQSSALYSISTLRLIT